MGNSMHVNTAKKSETDLLMIRLKRYKYSES